MVLKIKPESKKKLRGNILHKKWENKNTKRNISVPYQVPPLNPKYINITVNSNAIELYCSFCATMTT